MKSLLKELVLSLGPAIFLTILLRLVFHWPTVLVHLLFFNSYFASQYCIEKFWDKRKDSKRFAQGALLFNLFWLALLLTIGLPNRRGLTSPSFWELPESLQVILGFTYLSILVAWLMISFINRERK